jgi:hypothetical protein
MSMLEYNHVWTSTGSSGAVGSALKIDWPAVESVLMIQYSTLASTQSVSLQMAQESSGPWAVQTSTSISTANSTQITLRVTGPLGPGWVRPYLHSASTGTYQFRLLGVS